MSSLRDKEDTKLLPARSPLSDPETGEPLPPRSQPGYYPGFSTLAQEKYWDAATRLAVRKRLSEQPPLRFFTTEESETMLAVVDRILPQDDRTPDHRIPILPGIDERLFLNKLEGYRYVDMPSDQEAYRIAAQAFGAMAHKQYNDHFHVLDTLKQESLLKAVHDAKPQSAKELWAKLNLKRFWAMLVSDCCAVYYAHPFAWDEIGFGGPSYPRGYMRLENGQPEPWEVHEQRYEWRAPSDTLSDNNSHADSRRGHLSERGTL